jgi:glycosyltransferase involved in cell wall biosynthesis
MKHIVIVGKYYPPEFGGIERYTHNIAHIAAKNHRVTVVAHQHGRAEDSFEQDGNITVIRCGTSKIISAQPISPTMLKTLRSLKPDLIHFNAPNFWGAAMLSLARHKSPVIVTHHADVFGRPLLKRLVMPIYRHVTRNAACIIVNSLKNAIASDDLPNKRCKFVAIPWAVEEKAYRLDKNESAALMAERRDRFGNGPLVGFVGRFVRYKALPVLVDALSRLDNVHALLIGDGPLRAQIEEKVRADGIADRVHFLGNLDERGKIRAMGMMDMLALPSNDTTEAFGLVQVEAQLMGLPVVASRLPTGVTDVTLHEITGLLVPPNDSAALADAFTRLINDRALAIRLGAAGRERALRLFTMETFERRISELYDVVLDGQPLEDFIAALNAEADVITST